MPNEPKFSIFQNVYEFLVKTLSKSFNTGQMFELLITLSDNFGWDERGEVFDIGMRNISATKLREKTHFVFEVIMWKCFCSQNVLPCVCLNAKSENISILLQGSLTWCGGASPLVNPTADAIYKPPKPTLEVTCQTQSQTLGGRKWWLDGDLQFD